MRRRAVSHRPQTISPLLGLAPGGGYLAICITADAGGLLHHLFTITTSSQRTEAAVCFCGPFPAGSRLAINASGSPPRLLSDAVLYGVRTFLDPDNAGPRLPDQPEVIASYTLGEAESTLADDKSVPRYIIKVDISRKDIKIEIFLILFKRKYCE